MIAFSWYLLKVTIGSGILFAYYLLALRNRPHHRWNRFYLMTMTAAALVLPLLRFSFPWDAPASSGSTQWVQLLRVVNDNEHFFENADASASFSHIAWMPLAYGLLCIAFLVRMVVPYLQLLSTLRAAEIQSFGKVKLVASDDDKAPFTLFNYIFWNDKLDLRETAARQVLEHEMVHVREHHSLDKLFLNLSLIFCWPVPFLWFIRRELAMVHEFIADEASVEGRDSRAFAAMVLSAAYPGHPLDLTSSFFQSPIKRRLLMLMKNHTHSAGRIGRWMALPLIIITSAAFILRPTPLDPVKGSHAPKKKITVVIDAGHGGQDNGALGSDGSKEKDIALQVANRVKALNRNDSLNIILTRNTDAFIDLRERTAIAKRNNANLFLSLHLNADEDRTMKGKGMDIYVSARNKENEKSSQLFGSLLHKNLVPVYGISAELKSRKELGVWVLDDPEARNAAALLQMGYITNDQDLGFMKNPVNQDKVAMAILKTLESYTEGEQPVAFLMRDSATPTTANDPLYIVDGKTIPTPKDMNSVIKPEDIESINVWKGDSATIKYGPKGKNGVVEITSKSKAKTN